MQFFDKMKNGGWSMRGRFLLYAVSAIVTLVMLLLLLLSIFGVLNPADSRIRAYLDDQLDNHAARTEHDFDKLAAYTLSFSEQMEKIIGDQLDKSGMTFDDLTNDIDALTILQEQSYSTVYTNIRVAPCSGAFYILDTTVNDATDTPMKNGLYIKFANLYTENTINTKVALWRGSSEVARKNGINLSSSWQNEMKTNVFANTAVFGEKSFAISRVSEIPDTWKRARYIYSPIRLRDGRIVGICGFELSDLYLRLSYNTTDKQSKHAVCAIFDKNNGKYSGQFISNRSGYLPPEYSEISSEKHGVYNIYRCGNREYIGKESEIDIGGNALAVAAMLPKRQYNDAVFCGKLKIACIFFVIAAAAFCVCLWLSKKYINPIRKSISQFITNKKEYSPSGMTEIDDLFVFLADKDRKIEESIAEMKQQNTQIRNTLEQVINEHSLAKQEIARLAYSRKNEVDPDDYKQFLEGVKTLTPTEKAVFDLYLAGKNVKEIVETLDIKESTVRFHNRNIYSKLGVNSLKQLLLFAAIMKRE